MSLTITQNNSVTINVNGTNYVFEDPHPVLNLIDQLTYQQNIVTQRTAQIAAANAIIANLNTEIQSHCTTKA